MLVGVAVGVSVGVAVGVNVAVAVAVLVAVTVGDNTSLLFWDGWEERDSEMAAIANTVTRTKPDTTASICCAVLRFCHRPVPDWA